MRINREKCLGCGSCVRLFPHTFEIVEEKSIVKEDAKKLTEREIYKVIRVCPVKAIERK